MTRAPSLSDSHIQANVPSARSFADFMTRDLLAHFKDGKAPTATAVEYELLRAGPAQIGVALPKYYAWVKVLEGSTVLMEGAARVAAYEKKGFDVVGFISRTDILASPDTVSRVFPQVLLAPLQARASR
jgi:hypothetical protein